jgi:hypothetical protein
VGGLAAHRTPQAIQAHTCPFPAALAATGGEGHGIDGAEVPLTAAMSIVSSSKRSATLQVKAPCAPPPCSARLTAIRPARLQGSKACMEGTCRRRGLSYGVGRRLFVAAAGWAIYGTKEHEANHALHSAVPK